MHTKNITLTQILSKEEGIILGYASVFNIIDQHNDLIRAGAFKQLNLSKVKLLWQHKPEEPIGVIEKISEDQHGLFFKARLLLDLPQGKSAYNLIKAKAISGISIGFKPIKYHFKGTVRIIEEIDLWEISLVTFPANDKANIIEVKQLNKGKIMNQNHQQTWEDFKLINDEIQKSVEQKRTVDPLLKEQLNRINNHLDKYKSRIDNLETTVARPFLGEIQNHTDNEHKSAFSNYLRSGNEQGLGDIEQKALSVGSDTDGGYLVTRETSKAISQILEEISPMRQLSSHEKISTSSLDVIEDYNSAGAGWTSETKAITDTDTPKVNKRNIPIFELFAQPSATQKLIDDSSIDIERWLADKLVNSFLNLKIKPFSKATDQLVLAVS